MKKNIVPLIVIGALFLSILFGKLFLVPKDNYHLANGYTIDKFDTEVEVYKNNTFSVNEHITVNWTETGHSGITRVLSNWQDFTSYDGKNYNRFISISSLFSPDQFLAVEKLSNNQLKLTTGKPSDTVPIGSRTYQIRYNGNYGDDPNSDFDEFIYHAYGDNWGIKIGNPSLKIVLPSQVENLNIKFYADNSRKQDITDKVDYSFDGKNITAIVKDDYNLQGALTVSILLPNGYFANTSNPYKNISAYLCIIVVLSFASLLLLWIKFSKNNVRISKVPHGTIPDNLDSSQIGYIFKNTETSKRLSVSLIISLVSKGYIRIFNTGKNEYTAYNVAISDSSSFRNSDEYNIPQELSFVNPNKLKPLSKNEKIIYNKLFELNDVNRLYEDSKFYMVFDTINDELKTNIKPKLNVKSAKLIQILSWVITILSIMLMIFAYFAIHDIEPKLQFLYTLGWISCIGSIIPSFFIGKSSIYGEEIKKQIDDFKSFIENSTVEGLNNLTQTNAKIFYDILPYAYSMGIHKSWIDRLKNVSIPEEVHKEMDTINYYDYYMIDNISDNLRYPVKETNNENEK